MTESGSDTIEPVACCTEHEGKGLAGRYYAESVPATSPKGARLDLLWPTLFLILGLGGIARTEFRSAPAAIDVADSTAHWQ